MWCSQEELYLSLKEEKFRLCESLGQAGVLKRFVKHVILGYSTEFIAEGIVSLNVHQIIADMHLL